MAMIRYLAIDGLDEKTIQAVRLAAARVTAYREHGMASSAVGAGDSTVWHGSWVRPRRRQSFMRDWLRRLWHESRRP
jgi:hypothetical protein